MLSAFANTLKIPELRTRLLFTFGLLAICRMFAAVPVPGINGAALAMFFEKTAQQSGGGILGLYSLFTGGALENCAIGAMGMLLRETGNNTGDKKLVEAGNMVEDAIVSVTPKMKSQAAGKMGFSTTQVGDLVAAAV